MATSMADVVFVKILTLPSSIRVSGSLVAMRTSVSIFHSGSSRCEQFDLDLLASIQDIDLSQELNRDHLRSSEDNTFLEQKEIHMQDGTEVGDRGPDSSSIKQKDREGTSICPSRPVPSCPSCPSCPSSAISCLVKVMLWLECRDAVQCCTELQAFHLRWGF